LEDDYRQLEDSIFMAGVKDYVGENGVFIALVIKCGIFMYVKSLQGTEMWAFFLEYITLQ